MAFDSLIDTGLPVFPGYVGSDDELQRELAMLYKAFHKFQLGVDSISRFNATYDVAVTYGQILNILNSGGTHSKLASASATPLPAFGFCPTLGGVASATAGEVQTVGFIQNKTSLVPGTIYYLSDSVPGGYMNAKPVGAGKIVQPVGFAVSSTVLYFNPTLLYTQL